MVRTGIVQNDVVRWTSSFWWTTLEPVTQPEFEQLYRFFNPETPDNEIINVIKEYLGLQNCNTATHPEPEQLMLCIVNQALAKVNAYRASNLYRHAPKGMEPRMHGCEWHKILVIQALRVVHQHFARHFRDKPMNLEDILRYFETKLAELGQQQQQPVPQHSGGLHGCTYEPKELDPLKMQSQDDANQAFNCMDAYLRNAGVAGEDDDDDEWEAVGQASSSHLTSARHIAFNILGLPDYYPNLTSKRLRDRVVKGAARIVKGARTRGQRALVYTAVQVAKRYITDRRETLWEDVTIRAGERGDPGRLTPAQATTAMCRHNLPPGGLYAMHWVQGQMALECMSTVYKAMMELDSMHDRELSAGERETRDAATRMAKQLLGVVDLDWGEYLHEKDRLKGVIVRKARHILLHPEHTETRAWHKEIIRYALRVLSRRYRLPDMWNDVDATHQNQKERPGKPSTTSAFGAFGEGADRDDDAWGGGGGSTDDDPFGGDKNRVPACATASAPVSLCTIPMNVFGGDDDQGKRAYDCMLTLETEDARVQGKPASSRKKQDEDIQTRALKAARRVLRLQDVNKKYTQQEILASTKRIYQSLLRGGTGGVQDWQRRLLYRALLVLCRRWLPGVQAKDLLSKASS